VPLAFRPMITRPRKMATVPNGALAGCDAALEQEQQFFLSACLGKAGHINELRRRPNLGIGALQISPEPSLAWGVDRLARTDTPPPRGPQTGGPLLRTPHLWQRPSPPLGPALGESVRPQTVRGGNLPAFTVFATQGCKNSTARIQALIDFSDRENPVPRRPRRSRLVDRNVVAAEAERDRGLMAAPLPFIVRRANGRTPCGT